MVIILRKRKIPTKSDAMHILLSILINTLAVLLTGYILPGIHIASFWTAVVVAIVLGIVNAVLRPLLFILTLPLNILTLGLFSFVIMGGLVYLVSAIVPGFTVDNFWWAILFAIIVALVNAFLNPLRPTHR
jgi:putative membrane protein